MQAIILAAGLGSRLRPLTDSVPKALTEINGVPMLMRTLEMLTTQSISSICIVVGYLKEKIEESVGKNYKGIPITYIENKIYNKTNNNYSLYLCNDYISEDVLLIEGDLVFSQKALDTISDSQADANILVSAYNEKTMDGTVVFADQYKDAKFLLTKKQQNDSLDMTKGWKTVNIYKFKKNFIKNKFMPLLINYIETQNSNSYYELILGALVYYGNSNIKIVEIDAKEWAEVDDQEDLRRAEEKF